MSLRHVLAVLESLIDLVAVFSTMIMFNVSLEIMSTSNSHDREREELSE